MKYKAPVADLFDNRIVRQWDSLFVQFSITPLVNQFSYALQIRISETKMTMNEYACFTF